MTRIHYILLDHTTGKLSKVSNTSICGNLKFLSCFSRDKQLPIELLYSNRENKTIQIGIFPTALHISLTAYDISERNSLLVLEVVDGAEGGAPSASRPDGVPPTFRPRASGFSYLLEPHAHVVTRHHAKR